MREFTKITITRKGERMARGGHPWVFADEVLDVAGPVENGDMVDVVSEKKASTSVRVSITTTPRSGCA